jgi:cell division septation protein DedD
VPLQAVRQPAAPPIPEPGPTTPAFDEEPVPPIAEPGSKGVFTLQVSTFEDQDEAVAFMNMLRLRGHESFLVRAHGPDRGFLYRVRVGPFASQPEAERYRRRFERTERIPTFVVRRRLPGEE